MTTPGRDRLVSRSAAALFFGAGVVTLANSLVTRQLGEGRVHIHTLQLFGLISIASGFAVCWLLSRTRSLVARLAIATWGLALLVASSTWGGSATTTQAPTAIPVFMMVILVWLGLTSGRGVAAAFAPVTIAAAAFLSGVPGSRLELGAAIMVVAVSTVVAETIAWAMAELQKREELLAEQARTDPLTGLLNRAAFTDALDDCCARRERVILAFVDLNGFKDVNDTFGHQVGDEVLIEVGRRLRRIVHRSDVVARFGGDEFVVRCEHPAGRTEMHELARRLIDALSEPVVIGNASASVGASVGIAIGGGSRVTIDTLIRDADAALYQAKEEGRGRAVLFGSRA